MPAVLAIDTSTPQGGVAILVPEAGVVFEARFVANKSHNSEFVTPLEEALVALGDRPLGLIAVGTGPGSYTGIRIGISVAIGVSLSRGAPVVGVPSVCVVKEAETYHVAGDARRGTVFMAEVVKRKLAGEPVMVGSKDFKLPEGRLFTFDENPIAPELEPASPDPVVLAEVAASMTDREIEQAASQPVEPIYLRAPFITTPKKPGKSVPGATA